MTSARRFAGPVWVIVIWSVSLTILLGAVTNQIANAYLDNHSYFFDPVSYSFRNARLYVRLGEEGRLNLAVQEWLENGRHPLRTVPLLLFAPELLAKRTGHMATALPALGVFLFLLGWTIYRRTRYVPYALACMALFCALPGMFSPTRGLSAYWLDLPAAFLAGAAALCLLNSSGGRNLKWLAGFAVLTSGAVLSRYVAGVYVFVMCTPVLAGYLLLRWRREHSFTRSVVAPVALVGGIVGTLAGYFIVAHYRSNMHFYSTFGYALGHGVWAAAVSTLKSLYLFVGWPPVPGLLLALGLLGTFAVNLGVLRSKALNCQEQAAIGWLAISHILFLSVVVQAEGHAQAALYALPLLFLLAVSPALWKEARLVSKAPIVLAVIVFAAAALPGSWHAWRSYQQAQRPSPEAREQKNLDVALAQAVTKQGERLVWNAYFDEYAWIPAMEAFYRFGKFPLPAGQDYFFSIHESVWKGDYPGLTPDEVSRLVYDNTNQWVDVAVVFDDPMATDTQLNNDYSRAVAQYVAQAIRSDTRWERVFVVESSRYGTLAGYRNLAAHNSDTYDRRLQGQHLVQP